MSPKPQVDISYIVSAFNRPRMLPVILWALANQTHRNFEVIVTDNSLDRCTIAAHRLAIAQLKDSRFKHLHTGPHIKVSDPYWSAEYAVKRSRGHWYCFPCDDTYLVPEFGQRMLLAAYQNGWDMVICESVVVGPECNGRAGYKVWNMKPRQASKTTFILRASVFPGFTGKLGTEGAVLADYHLSGQVPNVGLVREQYMVVHN